MTQKRPIEQLAAYSSVYMGNDAYRLVASTPEGFFMSDDMYSITSVNGALDQTCSLYPNVAPPSWFRMVESTVHAEGCVKDPGEELATKYPKYWKPLPKGWKAIDTYRLGVLFPVNDPSGRLLHARKKLLIPGTRTGGKSQFDDIKEARDTLTGWLNDNQHEVEILFKVIT